MDTKKLVLPTIMYNTGTRDSTAADNALLRLQAFHDMIESKGADVLRANHSSFLIASSQPIIRKERL